VAAQLLGITKLFVLQHALCANVAKGSRQLVVVRIATRQAVVVNENPELALAHRRTVEVRQIIHCRAGRMHGRLVDQMYLTEKGWVADRRTGHGGQAFKKRHP